MAKELTPQEKTLCELDDKINALEQFCLLNKLPVYISVATEPLFGNIKYVTRSITPKDLKISVSEDRITPLSLSNNKHLKLTAIDEESEEDTSLGDLYADLVEQI